MVVGGGVVVIVVVVVVVVAVVAVVVVVRLVPKILHDFQHLHGFPATLNFNTALTDGLEKGRARMP